MILVIAGSYDEYLRWCRQHPEHIHNSRYVHGMEEVCGTAECEYVLIGRYYRNPLVRDSEFTYYSARHGITYNHELSDLR